MFRYIHLLLLAFSVPLLTQCSTTSSPPVSAVTGPFDSRGNYVEAWVDRPEKWYRPQSPSQQQAAARPSPPPQSYVREPIAPPQPLARTQISTLPKPTVSKPKPVVRTTPKPKPKLTRYTVKKGDHLGKIASKYSVSVAALRRANRISGEVIHPGQSLTIPR